MRWRNLHHLLVSLRVPVIQVTCIEDSRYGGLCRLGAIIHALVESLHSAGVPVMHLPLLMRAWQRCVDGADELERMVQLFGSCVKAGGEAPPAAMLAPVCTDEGHVSVSNIHESDQECESLRQDHCACRVSAV